MIQQRTFGLIYMQSVTGRLWDWIEDLWGFCICGWARLQGPEINNKWAAVSFLSTQKPPPTHISTRSQQTTSLLASLQWRFPDLCETEEEADAAHKLQHLPGIILKDVCAGHTRWRSGSSAHLGEKKTSKQNTILTKLLLRRKLRKSFQSVLLTAGHELLFAWEKPQQFRVLSTSFWVSSDLFHPASSSKFCRWKSASLELNSCTRDLKVIMKWSFI